MSAMTIAVAVAVDTIAGLEMPLSADFIRLFAPLSLRIVAGALCPQAGKTFVGWKNFAAARAG
jgi:hypothetical protein